MSETSMSMILRRPTDWAREFINRSVTIGELLGEGYYSRVYDVIEDDDSVIKCSPYNDYTIQYLLLAFIMEHSIKGRPEWMPHVKAVYAAEGHIEFYIEKLTPLDIQNNHVNYKRYLEALQNYAQNENGLFSEFHTMQIEVFGSARSDLHNENVMLRGDTLVITDPFSNGIPSEELFEEYMRIAQQVAPKYADVQRKLNGA